MTSIDALAPWVAVILVAIIGAATGVVVLKRVTPSVLAAVERPATADTVEADGSTGTETPSATSRAEESNRDSHGESEGTDQSPETGRVAPSEEATGPDAAEGGRSIRQVALIASSLGLGTVMVLGAIVVASLDQVIVGAAAYVVGLTLMIVGVRVMETTGADSETTERTGSGGEASPESQSPADRPGMHAAATATDADGSGDVNAERRTESDVVDRTDGVPSASTGDAIEAVETPTPMRATGNSVMTRANRINPVGTVETPAPMRTSENSVVTRANRLGPVETPETPEPIATAETVSVVERERRLGPVAAPTAMKTDGIDVVEEATRIEAVGRGEATDTGEGLDEDEVEPEVTILCEYCGRDDFESIPQRNGHLRWCDEYDPNAPGEIDDDSADAAEPDAERRAVSESTGTEDTVEVEMNQEPRTEPKAETAEESETVAETTASTDDTAGQTETDVRTDSVDGDGSAEGDSPEGGDGSGDEDTLDDFAVVEAYVAVRQELQEEFDIDGQRTSREFYHLCRNRGLDEERLAALEQLTQAYEAVRYSDDPEIEVDELRAAAERFEADVLKQSR